MTDVTDRFRLELPSFEVHRLNGRPWVVHPLGYLTAGYDIGGKAVTFYYHRVKWELATGKPPAGEIDHRDGDTSNNKMGNLRDVPHRTNQRNMKMHKTNTTGFNGVTQEKSGRFRAYFWNSDLQAKQNLGLYDTAEEAGRVARAARVGYSPRHGL